MSYFRDNYNFCVFFSEKSHVKNLEKSEKSSPMLGSCCTAQAISRRGPGDGLPGEDGVAGLVRGDLGVRVICDPRFWAEILQAPAVGLEAGVL